MTTRPTPADPSAGWLAGEACLNGHDLEPRAGWNVRRDENGAVVLVFWCSHHEHELGAVLVPTEAERLGVALITAADGRDLLDPDAAAALAAALSDPEGPPLQ